MSHPEFDLPDDWDTRAAAMFEVARNILDRKGKPKPFGWDAVGKNEILAEGVVAFVEYLQGGGEVPPFLRPAGTPTTRVATPDLATVGRAVAALGALVLGESANTTRTAQARADLVVAIKALEAAFPPVHR